MVYLLVCLCFPFFDGKKESNPISTRLCIGLEVEIRRQESNYRGRDFQSGFKFEV